MSNALQSTSSQGYAIGRSIQAGAWIELLRLGVRPSFRRQGLAKKMLYHMEAMVKKYYRGAQSIHIELKAGNLRAKKLYENCAYNLIGQREAYYQDGTDALLMSKEPL